MGGKKKMGFKVRESNLKMKSWANPFFSWSYCGVVWHVSSLFWFFWFFFAIVSVVLILWNTKVLVEMLVLKNCGSFEIQCFPFVAVALLWCTEAEFRLDFHSADWNLQNGEHPNRVSVFQHIEQLILTLLMSWTKPQWIWPNWGFHLNNFKFCFLYKAGASFFRGSWWGDFVCVYLGFASKAGFSLLLFIFGWLSHSVFSFTIEPTCV